MTTLKRCDCCIAMLPTSDYGKSRSSKDLLNGTCILCCRERAKRIYNMKFGHVTYDRLHTGNYRNVKVHNKTLIDHCFDNPSTFIYGFVPHTEISFKVYIGDSSLTHHKCLRLTLLNADVPDQEYAIPEQDPNVVDTLLYILKGMSIRLERTDSDMLDSKQSIYYIGLL